MKKRVMDTVEIMVGRREIRTDSATLAQHIVLNGNDEMDIFNYDSDREYFLECLEKACKNFGVKLLVYALMDNHVHLILYGEIERYEGVFESIGATYARWFNAEYNHHGHFWRGRFYNEPINSPEQFRNTMAYIFNNPVSAKACENPQDYEWSNFNQLREGTFDEEATKIIDEITNVDYALSYTITAAAQILNDIRDVKEEYARAREVCGAKLRDIIAKYCNGSRFVTDVTEDVRRKIVAEMWELGACVYRIARVCQFTRYFVSKVIEEL